MHNTENWTGKVQVVQSRIFEALMAIPGDTWGALKELIDNPIDAQATEIFVIRDEDRLTIMDNGHGMVPHMSQEDYDLLGYFKEELNAGKDPGEVSSIPKERSITRSYGRLSVLVFRPNRFRSGALKELF